jgi:hypothetical protein
LCEAERVLADLNTVRRLEHTRGVIYP